MGFFRNDLPFRWRKISGFFDSLKNPGCESNRGSYLSETALSFWDSLKNDPSAGQRPAEGVRFTSSLAYRVEIQRQHAGAHMGAGHRLVGHQQDGAPMARLP